MTDYIDRELYTRQDILNLEKKYQDRLNIKITMEDRTESKWDKI